MAQGRSVTFFMEDGNADGIITMDLHGWDGSAMLIPRDSVNSCNSLELKDTGVYLLLCNSYNADRSVYIGEAVNVQKRLVRHIHDYDNGMEEFFWEMAVVFTAGASLNSVLTQYVRERLIQIATEADSYNVITKRNVGGTKLKPSARSDMETFIDNALVIVRLLGFYVFEKPAKCNSKPQGNVKKYYCRNAVMHIEDNVFIVEKGSRISGEPSRNFVQKNNYYKKLLQLQNARIIVDLEFVKDCPFESPSAAAAVILGRSANGKIEWKDEDGIPLKNWIK